MEVRICYREGSCEQADYCSGRSRTRSTRQPHSPHLVQNHGECRLCEVCGDDCGIRLERIGTPEVDFIDAVAIFNSWQPLDVDRSSHVCVLQVNNLVRVTCRMRDCTIRHVDKQKLSVDSTVIVSRHGHSCWVSLSRGTRNEGEEHGNTIHLKMWPLSMILYHAHTAGSFEND